MSVLIKGMEMPTSCGRCRCVRGCKAVNDRIKRLDKEPWLPGDHRHSDCPLVPVPPHGRLIDADALMDNDGDVWDGMWGYSGVEIMNAPTIIEEER